MAQFSANVINRGNNYGGGGYTNNMPYIVSKFINQSMEDDEPMAEPDDDDNAKKRQRKKTQISGDVRLTNLEFSRLRVAEFSNAYLGCIGLG